MPKQLTPATLAEIVEFVEVAAHVDMCLAAPASLGIRVEESKECVAFFAPGIDALPFNRVMGLGLRGEPSQRLVESLITRYRASGVRNYGIQLSPQAESLSGWMSGCDLHVRDFWTKLYRSVDTLAPIVTDLRIEKIDRASGNEFGETACTGFGLPHTLVPMLSATIGKNGWHHYIAWDEAKPAAVAALFVRDHIGWLGVAATLPQYQRRGAQGALMSRRILDGMKLGCQWFVAETAQDLPEKPNPSFHNMIRTGFSVVYDRPNYMPPRNS